MKNIILLSALQLFSLSAFCQPFQGVTQDADGVTSDVIIPADKTLTLSGTLAGTPSGTIDLSGVTLTLPADVLRDADVGVQVQAYDAGLAWLDTLNFTNEAAFKAAVNLEAEAQAIVDGVMADPSTNGSFDPDAWAIDLALQLSDISDAGTMAAQDADSVAITDGVVSADLSGSDQVPGITKGIWLVDGSTGLSAEYASLSAAFTAATDGQGDRIVIGPGDYTIGAITWNKADVALVGSGFTGPSDNNDDIPENPNATILRGAITVTTSGVGFEFRNFSLISNTSGNKFIVQYTSAIEYHGLIKNLRIIELDAHKSVNHILEINGGYIDLINVWTYGDGSGSGHAFSIKGANNINIIDCGSVGSGFDGLLLAADTSSWQDNSDIYVDGFTAIGASAFALYINNRTGSDNENIIIKNFRGINCAKGVGVGSSTGTATSNEVRDSYIDAYLDGVISGVSAALSFADTGVQNTLFKVKGVNIGSGTGTFEVTTPSTPFDVDYVLDLDTADYGRVVSRGNATYETVTNKTHAQEVDITLGRRISVALGSSRIDGIEATTTTNLYVTADSGYQWDMSEIEVGDPVRLSGSGIDGTYRVVGSGQATAANTVNGDTIVGAPSGDEYYLQLEGSGFTVGTYSVGAVIPGAVVGRWEQNGNGSVIFNIDSYSTHSTGSRGFARKMTGELLIDASPTIESWGTSAIYTNTATSLYTYAAPIEWENEFYLCVFGNATTTFQNSNHAAIMLNGVITAVGGPSGLVRTDTLPAP
jgi:hypothetical protein